MKRAAILVTILLFGCATARDYATLTMYRAQRKVLVFAQSPCGGPGSKEPYLVSAWVREKDLNNAVVVCNAECKACRVEAPPARKPAPKKAKR